MAKIVMFESNFLNLTLVRVQKAQIPIPDGTGWQTTRKTVEYQFQPESSQRGEYGWVGVLRVKEGQDKLKSDGEGWLREGEDVGVERDAVAALLAHRSFGTKFWLVGHEPGTLYPRDVDTRAAIRKASVALDEETLVNMIAEERRTHGRADLISEAEDALELVRGALAEVAAHQAAQEAAPKAKAKPKAPAAA